jgi:hypothetical protein
MVNKLIAACLLLTVAVLSPALDVQRGKLKVTVNERTGRIVVWGTEDPAQPVWTPLYLATDPTTTKWKIQVGDKVAVLGDDSSFATSVTITPTGAKVLWTGKALSLTLALDFVVSAGGAAADGLRLTLSALNVSEASLRVGVRWVLDTNLGEKKDHFRLSSGEALSAETRLEGDLPEAWTSAGSDGPGLLVMVGKAATVPSRVMFANWKRLDDASWDPGFKAGRDFNLLPYSFNDSAVAQFYDAQDLAPGAARDVVVLLGLSSTKTLAGAKVVSANPVDDLLQTSQDSGLSVLDQDLASLTALLSQIDARLAAPGRLTAEELQVLLEAVDQIDARRQALEASKP